MIDSPTPFQQVFNPDNDGTLTGMIGRAVGNPGAGDARGQALQELAKIMQQPGPDGNPINPQKAVMQFLGTQNGANYFARDPNAAQSIQQFIASMTPPAPQMNTVAPGMQQTSTDQFSGKTTPGVFNPQSPMAIQPGEVIGQPSTTPGGPVRLGVENPRTIGAGSTVAPATGANAGSPVIETEPPAAANVRAMARGAGYGPQETKDLYASQGQTVEGRAGQAIKDMVKNGEISPEWGRKLEAGALEWKQERDNFDVPNGWGLYDKSSGQRIAIRKDIPAALRPAAAAEPAFDLKNPADTPHLASGGLNMLANEGGKAVRMVTDSNNPALTDTLLLSDRRNKLYEINGALAAIQRQAQVGGPRSEAAAQRILANGPDMGLNVDPKSQLNKLITLRQTVQRELDANNEIITNGGPTVSTEVKKQASQANAAYEHVLRTLPSEKKLAAAKALCDKGNCGGLSTKDLVKTTKGLGTSAIDTATDTASEVTGHPDPAAIPTMGREELGKLDPSKMSPADIAAVRKRIQQLRQMPPGGGATPYQPEEGAGPSVPQFMKNPDGSMTTSPDRINQAFDVLAQAHRAGMLNGGSGSARTAPPRKRPPARQ